jgi:hypothetical protein
MKSRTFRARAQLADPMGIDDPQEFGPDRAIQAALSSGDLRWAS